MGGDEIRKDDKRERRPWRGGGENEKKNIVARRTVFVIIFKGYIQELISSDCANDDFL